MTGDFRQALAEKSKKIHRWATRRTIEEDGYHVEPWYDGKSAASTEWQGKEILTLAQYRKDYGRDSSQINDGFYAPYEGEVWNHVYKQFDWIEERIERFGHAKPSALESLLKSIRPIALYLKARKGWSSGQKFESKTFPFDDDLSLEGAFGEAEMRGDILLQSAMEELNNFSGETADAYVAGFGPHGERWEEVLENDYLLAEVLVKTLEAQLAVCITERESIMNVCDATLERLWGLSGGGEIAKNSTMLTIIGAVVGVGITMATGGSALALVGAGFSITSAMVAQAESDAEIEKKGSRNGSEIKISGGDVIDILASCSGEVDKIIEKAVEHENDIAKALRKSYDYVVGSAGTRSKFEIMLDKGTPKNDFGSREISTNEDSLVLAATQLFPASADRVLTVHELLASSGGDNPDAFIDENTGGSATISTSWLALRDLLQDLTGANGGKIKRSGEYLYEFAKETGALDDANAEEIDKVHKDYDHDIKDSGRDHGPWGY